jgi:acetyl esterase/lipase
MIALAYTLSGLSLLQSVLFLIKQPKLPLGFLVAFLKLIAGALSPYWAIMGAVGALIGWVYEAYWAIPIGVVGAAMMILYIWRNTRDHKELENAFGADWKDQITPQQAKNMVKRRWSPYLKMKASPEPSWERDIPFWTVPDSDRELLCDIWLPEDGKVSGLAIIYYHGSAWFAFGKDMGTRPFFRHLVAQGHTVMDVAYRLCPETDIYGMVADVKRAIAWMKANAPSYGVNPEKIVLAGGSAGGHLSLLAAYAPGHPDLTPEEIQDIDLSVHGVISYYGPTDLLAQYQYNDIEHFADLVPPVPIGKELEPKMRLQYAGRVDILLGGHPQDARDTYQLASPPTHVHPGCPPTLLFHGDQDILVPVKSTCALYTKLVQSKVPAINVVYPWTNHIFDLLLPQLSPPAQSALYDVDRFLALLLNKD